MGLKLTHVREILKNPVYFGRLRTGEDSGGPPLVPRALWDEVAVVRGKYSRRHRGPVSRRTYALSTLLHCAACGRRLTGHVGRYRHVDACAEFKAAKPTMVPWRSPGDRRLKGESYKIEVYDNLVPQLLSRVSVGAKTMTQVVDGLATPPSSTFTLARVERDREAALRKYRQDRDTTALERTMKRLDEEEREAQTATEVISADEAVSWLQDLPALWAAADDSGRRLLTEVLFEKVEVLGVRSVTIHPTPEADAHGWSEAFGATPQLIPVEMVAGAIGTDGRGERGRASLAHLRFRPRFVLENVSRAARRWPVDLRKAG